MNPDYFSMPGYPLNPPVFRAGKLFCDPLCDRQLLMRHYNLTAAQLGAAFARGSEYDSLSDFIRECRLEYACTLLTGSDKQIDEVAREAGFSRTTTFNHDFKVRNSLSPSEYRRQNISDIDQYYSMPLT